MPSLNFEKKSKNDTAVAIVRGGERDGSLLWLNIDDIPGEISHNLSQDERFEVIPNANPEHRQVWYAAGASGSGKSYFARGIAENYKKLFPNREVYLISKLQYDDTLDESKIAKPKRIDIQSLMDDYPSLEEFEDCLIIFDDYDTLEKKQYEVVQKLINDLAIQGRHTRTSMLVLSHYLSNYNKTRLILMEAHYLTLYPMATSGKALMNVCVNYAGLEPEHVKEMKRLGRWVMISKNYPAYIISGRKAYMPYVTE